MRNTSREAAYVAVVLAAMALLYRFAWLPSDPQVALNHAWETLGLPVTAVMDWFSAWTLGDGQVFAIIATDPLGLDEGMQLSLPAYRYSRAGFGWLAWVASLGRPEWVPYGMAVVGAASVVLCFILARRLSPLLGRSAWLIAVNPALLIAFAGDTAESLGVLALAYGLATGHVWVAAALGVIRPSFLVALVGRWGMLIVGVATAGVMALVWGLRFGFAPGQYGVAFTLPFVGYVSEPSAAAITLGILATLTLAVGIRRRDWAWASSGATVLCFNDIVLQSPNNGWRAAGMMFVLWAFGPRYSIADGRRGLIRRRSATAMKT